MSNFTHDINKFDELVRNESFREDFLNGFKRGWEEKTSRVPKMSGDEYREQLRTMINIFSSGLYENPRRFGTYLGYFMCDVREHQIVLLANPKLIIEIIQVLKRLPEEWYKLIRQAMIEWVERIPNVLEFDFASWNPQTRERKIIELTPDIDEIKSVI